MVYLTVAYVHGNMDCRTATGGGRPAVEWSWDGNDEPHPAAGRGWAVLQEDGTLVGKIFFHDGDDYEFKAENWPGLKGMRSASAS